MLDQEPLNFPFRTRDRYPYDPGVSDRQLWAIGMIVVQWSATESFIESNTRNLIRGDDAAIDQYERLKGFKNALAFWKSQLEARGKEPSKTQLLNLFPRIQMLSSQRDHVVHKLWGGGMEQQSPNSEGHETTDAGMLLDQGTPIKGKGPLIPFAWHADFQRLRKMAGEMAALNRDLLLVTIIGFGSGEPVTEK